MPVRSGAKQYDVATKRSTRSSPREALVRAGTHLFGRYGLRRTTMEGIAAEAGVAKATAYAYFDNKEELFATVCAEVAREVETVAEEAARAAPTPERAVKALVLAKFTRLYEVMQGSPHARELLEASQAEDEVNRAHARHLRRMRKRLGECRAIGPAAAREVAETLEAAAEGITARAKDARDLRSKLDLLVTRVLGK
jgi:AcrR family transcriptional regulator